MSISDLDPTLFKNREIIINSLGDIGSDMLIALYGSIQNFLNVDPENISPLEKYIIAFDENMDDAGMTITLAERMGLAISPEPDNIPSPQELFIDKVLDYIFYVEPVIGNSYPTTKQIIDMNKSEYETLNVDLPYEDRLSAMYLLHQTEG